MAYLTLEDEEESTEVIVFPDIYKSLADTSKAESILVVKGVLDKTEKGLKIVAKEVADLAHVLAQNKSNRIEITVHSGIAKPECLRSLRGIVGAYQGECPLHLRMELGTLSVLLATCLRVDPSASFVRKIEELAGKGSVRIA